MLMLLFIPIVYVVACAQRYLQLSAPSNLLVAWVRRSPPRWGIAVLLLGLAYGLIWASHHLSMVIQHGAPGWLNVVVLILAWDSVKVALLGILTAVQCLISSVIQ